MHPKSKHKHHHPVSSDQYQKQTISTQYHIPKNKCQQCYNAIGRYILDCYCILCQSCYAGVGRRNVNCQLCGNKTKGNFIDAKNESSINKISHLFGNVENTLNKTVEVYKFQNNIANKYCKYLQIKLKAYQKAVDDLINANPQLQQYFKNRLSTETKTQQYSKSNLHLTSTSTNKPNQNTMGGPVNEFDPLCMHHKVKQYGGSGAYKVSNLNYSTALRSSKRSTKFEEEDSYMYQKYNRK